MTEAIRQQLMDWAVKYNDPVYFQTDPIIFPRHFLASGACLQDIEIAGVFAAHFAWGRRAMIVRDCERLFDHMEWKPFEYVMAGQWRDDDSSIHRTVKWSDTAAICARLKDFYEAPGSRSLEELDAPAMRKLVYGQKEDPKAPNKKINMMRRWFVRDDGAVDLGIWKHSSPADLVIPLDVHVYTQATALGLTDRRQKDLATALQITDAFRDIFPGDPVKGDFALFGYGVNNA